MAQFWIESYSKRRSERKERRKEGQTEGRKEGRNHIFCTFLRTLTGIPFAMKPTLPKILFPSCSYFLNFHSFSLSLIFRLLFLHQLTQHLVFSSPHFPTFFLLVPPFHFLWPLLYQSINSALCNLEDPRKDRTLIAGACNVFLGHQLVGSLVKPVGPLSEQCF